MYQDTEKPLEFRNRMTNNTIRKYFQPIVFQIGKEFYATEHTRNDNKIYCETNSHDFRLALPGKPAIEVEDIIEYDFAVRKSKRQSQNPFYKYCDYVYMAMHAFEKVIEEKDCDDSILIIKKCLPRVIAWQQTYDILYYYSFYLRYTIHNVLYTQSIRDVDGMLYAIIDRPTGTGECNDFKRVYICGGVEKTQAECDFSLKQWCELFGYQQKILDLYDDTNEKSSEVISWKSRNNVVWHCNKGHKWETRLCDITTSNLMLLTCPICQKQIDDERHELCRRIDEHEALLTENALLKYRTTDVKKAFKLALADLIPHIEQAYHIQEWLPREADWPEYVSFTFVYPNGKDGEINMCIATEFGNVTQIDALNYKVTISTLYVDAIAFLSESSGTKEKHYEFLERANTRFVLATYMGTVDALWHAQGKSSWYDYTLNKETNDIRRDYRAELRKRRNKIYESLLVKGQVSSKWKSEQQAYTIVKSLYPNTVYQFHCEWLGYQSIDIFIPELSIGIEYQGQQHYFDIDYFGGKGGLEERQQLDKRKKELCKSNGIRLIEWKYDEPLTVEYIMEKIHSEIG